jgi:hypothetical protein
LRPFGLGYLETSAGIVDARYHPSKVGLALCPTEKYLRQRSVWLEVVALAAHQEQIVDCVDAAERSRHDVTPLQRNAIPLAEDLSPLRGRTLDVVLVAVVEAAGPTAWLTPIDEQAELAQARLPIFENLRLQGQVR